jgi:hypothetical protein
LREIIAGIRYPFRWDLAACGASWHEKSVITGRCAILNFRDEGPMKAGPFCGDIVDGRHERRMKVL